MVNSTIKIVRALINENKHKEALAAALEILELDHYPQSLRTQLKKIVRQLSAILDHSETDDPLEPGLSDALDVQKPFRCTVVSWDTNHNCIGRAYLLCILLRSLFKRVELVGFGFKHIGSNIWQPIRDEGISVIQFDPPESTKDLLVICDTLSDAIRTDVIIASKARLPSIMLACFVKLKLQVPLIVDIDDYDLGFTDYKELPNRATLDLNKQFYSRLGETPYTGFWTKYAESMLHHADEIITSSMPLKNVYGGCEIIPHARNRSASNNKFLQELNDSFFIPKGTKIVMFLGTPRKHKGVVEIASACKSIEALAVRFVIVGGISDKHLEAEVTKAGEGNVIVVDAIPFSSIADYLSAADLVALIQDDNNLASRFQLPAKIVDALALGKRVLATPTPVIMSLLDLGIKSIRLYEGNEPLSASIEKALLLPPMTYEEVKSDQKIFDEHMSVSACVKKIKNSINNAGMRGVLARDCLTTKPIGNIYQFAQVARMLSGHSITNNYLENKPINRIAVILWKQNDFGIFGRRVDMIASEITHSPELRIDHVIVFEKPSSVYNLSKLDNSENDHNKLILKYLGLKRHGLLNTDKISVHSQIINSGLTSTEKQTTIGNYFQEVISDFILKNFIVDLQIDLWIYPYYEYAKLAIDILKPSRIIVDVIDDHRRWAGLNAEQIERYDEHYNQLLNAADVSIYNCKETFYSIGNYAANKRMLIPNGIDARKVCSSLDPKSNEKIDFISNTIFKTVIGYVGNLEAKIDWDLIEKISSNNQESLIILIGSTHMAARLPERPNILYTGPIEYSKIESYIASFDIAIIPHFCNSFTHAMNPLKAYVYSLYRIPIVATDLPNLPSPDDLPQLMLSKSHEEFLLNIDKALLAKQSFKDNKAIDRFIKENSWEMRLKHLTKYLA